MNSGHQLKVIVVVSVSALLIYGLIRTLSVDDESRVKKVIYTGALAVEQRNLFRCASLIDESYQDDSGYDKMNVLGFLREFFNF